jgi:heme-degrading monooxygenase HmoA
MLLAAQADVFNQIKAMFISITYIKVRSIRKMPLFMKHVSRINRQLRQSEGIIDSRLRGGFARNYTLTAWESKAAMQRFRKQGAHLDAMRAISHVSNEYASCHYEADTLPDWKEALQKVHACLSDSPKRA